MTTLCQQEYALLIFLMNNTRQLFYLFFKVDRCDHVSHIAIHHQPAYKPFQVFRQEYHFYLAVNLAFRYKAVIILLLIDVRYYAFFQRGESLLVGFFSLAEREIYSFRLGCSVLKRSPVNEIPDIRSSLKSR